MWAVTLDSEVAVVIDKWDPWNLKAARGEQTHAYTQKEKSTKMLVKVLENLFCPI